MVYDYSHTHRVELKLLGLYCTSPFLQKVIFSKFETVSIKKNKKKLHLIKHYVNFVSCASCSSHDYIMVKADTDIVSFLHPGGKGGVVGLRPVT